MLHLQNKILRMIAEGRSADETAHALCSSLAAVDPDLRGAIFVDDGSDAPRLAVGSLPESEGALRREFSWGEGGYLGTFAIWAEGHAVAEERLKAIADDCADLLVIAFERDQVRREKHWLAFHDALSGLLNRASFTRDLHRCVAANSPLALLLIDIDRLKVVNDTSGHDAGDLLISEVARRLASAAHPFATYRIGGDEFAVLMPGATPDAMGDAAGTLIRSVSPALEQGDLVLCPSVTIGGAHVGTASDADKLRREADFALYHAKEVNSGGFVAYEAGLGTSISARFNAIRSIGTALEQGCVEAYYQPVVRLDTRAIVGVEALCRMRAPDGSMIPAASFRPALNDARMARRITEFMMERVAADVRSWLDLGIPFQHVGLNVGPADLQTGLLLDRLRSRFEGAGVPLKHVILEVAEGACIGGSEREITHRIRDLRSAGILVALDDFGTGYASLTHLLSAPVDILKLDRSFACRIAPGDPGAHVVQSLIQISRKLGLRVVAEGLETAEQAERLLGFGCQLGQGYHFARPGDFAQTTGWLERLAQGTSAAAGWNVPVLQAHRS